MRGYLGPDFTIPGSGVRGVHNIGVSLCQGGVGCQSFERGERERRRGGGGGEGGLSPAKSHQASKK